MINLSSYHSTGLPTVVWSNKVNLIGEKVFKPKIHFCEHCNKPILIYGRLIPCKHVFCYSCALLCLTNQPPSLLANQLQLHSSSPVQATSPGTHNSSITISNEPLNHQQHSSRVSADNNNHSDESTSNTTIQHDNNTIISPSLSINHNNVIRASSNNVNNSVITGCHRCGGKALRVERNTLNSIFVCQVESCKRTYLSARDLQAHITHRHSRNKSNNSNNAGTSASMAAISSSPYISSSTLQHLSNHNQTSGSAATGTASNNNQQAHHSRQSSSSQSTLNNNNSNNHTNHHDSPNHHHNRRDRESNHHHNHHHSGGSTRDRERDRDRYRDRDSYQRERERERDSKEYHRQSLQRAAQWAEASAQMLEKGLTR